MDCQGTQKQLQEYLDGQLSAAQMAALQAHLATCAACAQELALLSQVNEALVTYPVLEAPQGLAARTMAQIRGEPAPFPPLAFRLRWEDALVSAAFATALTSLLLAVLLPWSGDISSPQVWLEGALRIWLPRLNRLWLTVQTQPMVVIGPLSSACAAAAAAASAVVLTQHYLRWREVRR